MKPLQQYARQESRNRGAAILAIILIISIFAAARGLRGQAPSGSLTGNWLIAITNRDDGTVRRTYLNLQQDGDKVSGTIRTTSSFYTIRDSSRSGDEFSLTAVAKDGDGERTVIYAVKLAGNELHVTTRRNATAQPVEQIGHRAPAGEGAMPARIPPPALHKVTDNGLARTPPMGWNSWNKFASRVSDEVVRGVADAMASNGMKEAGYVYINIDDTWEGERDAQGNIQSNKKFPNMKALADYVHSKGLKIGIYSSPGLATCAGYEGSYGHEAQDARTYAAWGIDYLKYDWCTARTFYTDDEMPAVYQVMGDALLATGRPIVFSLCQYGRHNVWKWGADAGGNLWRTTDDISDSWKSMTDIGFAQGEIAQYAKPGHWNDPDMLEIGNGGMTDVEYQTHMTLWSMLAAPLMAGNDLRTMSKSIHDILTNHDVIAIDQDALGKQATRASAQGSTEIWSRPLAGEARAIALFNRGTEPAEMRLNFTAAGIANGVHARDIWAAKDLGPLTGEYRVTVPAHGVVLLRLTK